jgi:hypothetical protein
LVFQEFKAPIFQNPQFKESTAGYRRKDKEGGERSERKTRKKLLDDLKERRG